MAQYQPETYDYPEPDEYFEQYPDKSKRLAAPQHHPLVEVVVWGFVGTVGLAMTVGSIIVAANTNSPATMIIPLIYMIIAMGVMKRR